MRVFYLHYGPSGAIRPLVDSAALLVNAGHEAMFLSVEGRYTSALGKPAGDRITVKELFLPQSTFGRRLLMLKFCIQAVWIAVSWRAEWIYVVDSPSCPAAVLVRLLARRRMLYHEFDLPETPTTGFLPRLLLGTRRVVARGADICIASNDKRAEHLSRETGRKEVMVVLNCPLRKTAETKPDKIGGEKLRIYYHGTLSPERLPRSVIAAIAALPDNVLLTVAGYETMGSRGYTGQLQALAEEKGVSARVRFLGTVQGGGALARLAREQDVGLALMELESCRPNHRTMVGASVKVFDYLAAGLALLVSDIPDWTRTYVAPGYGLNCDPGSSESIKRAIQRFVDGTANAAMMGEAGRQRVLNDWNFEFQFAPVLERMLTDLP